MQRPEALLLVVAATAIATLAALPTALGPLAAGSGFLVIIYFTILVAAGVMLSRSSRGSASRFGRALRISYLVMVPSLLIALAGWRYTFFPEGAYINYGAGAAMLRGMPWILVPNVILGTLALKFFDGRPWPIAAVFSAAFALASVALTVIVVLAFTYIASEALHRIP